MTAAEYIITFDGGSIGNPGKAYGSFELLSPTGRRVRERHEFPELGNRATNNQAEYLSLIRAMERLRSLLGERASTVRVLVYGDSQLVIQQLGGAWKVKNATLRPLHLQAKELLESFAGYRLQWHDRSNSVAILGH